MTEVRLDAGSTPSAAARLLSGAPACPPGAPGCRPTWADVDLDAIAANVGVLKEHATAPLLMAVVKADGYGHGLVPSARAALAGGADWLGVALVEEGQSLRDAGVDAPILVLTEPPVDGIPAILAGRLTPTVYSPGFVDALDAAAREAAAEVPVHLKLDTGMHRVGVPEADWEDALRRVGRAGALRVDALWSHLAVADEPDNAYNRMQADAFRRGLALAGRLGVRPRIAHLCNSAGAVWLHNEQHDLIRTGIAVYGLDPTPQRAHGLDLRPALTWRSSVTLVKRIPAGTTVSYGRRWTAPRPTVVGTVAAGYADGVRRSLTNVGEVLVGGRRRRIVGTVCMDQFLVDLGDDDAVAAGDEVVLIGEQHGARVSAEEWAAWLGTINYEIVCGIGPRVPRVHTGSAGVAR